MDKLADQYAEQVTFLCINTRTVDDAKKYKEMKGLKSENLIHGANRPPAEYGLKYIPHKVIIDKDGKVSKNFDDVNLESDLANMS